MYEGSGLRANGQMIEIKAEQVFREPKRILKFQGYNQGRNRNLFFASGQAVSRSYIK